jgi:uncharacterized protein (DUF2384 family)
MKVSKLDEGIMVNESEYKQLMNEVEEYFGSPGSSMIWMKTTNIGLGNVTPSSLCTSLAGINRVRNSINRLNHGMTA